MSFVKKVLLFISGFVFRTTLYFGFTALAAVLILNNKANIKQIFREQNVYDRFGSALVSEVKKSSVGEIGLIPFDSPEVQKIVKSSVDAKTLNAISEGFIDSGFDFLQNKSPNIDYSYEVSKNKNVFAKGVSDYAFDRLATFKPCTSVPSANINIFQLDCNPTFLNISKERQNLYNTIYTSDKLLPTNKLELKTTDKNLALAGNVYDTYRLKQGYRFFVSLPYIILGLSLLSGIIFWALHRTKRAGFKAVSSYFISSGIFLAITPLLYTYFLPILGVSLPGSKLGTTEAFASISSSIVNALYGQFNVYLINIALQLVVVGIILRLILKFTKSGRSIYKDVAKKSGLTTSMKGSVNQKNSLYSSIPIQTSEANKVISKKSIKIKDKYRKILGR